MKRLQSRGRVVGGTRSDNLATTRTHYYCIMMYKWLKGEGHTKNKTFLASMHYLACVVDREKNLKFLTLPFTQETSFFSAFLHGLYSGSKNSSILYVTSQRECTLYVGISVDRMVHCVASSCFMLHSEGVNL